MEMRRVWKVGSVVALGLMLAVGCTDTESSEPVADAAVDAAEPTEIYDDPATGSSPGDPKPEPGPEPGMDAAAPERDASVEPLPVELDASLPSEPDATLMEPVGCIEIFVFDPGERKDIQTVVLAGGPPLSWSPTATGGASIMTLDEDGKFRVQVEMVPRVVPYKFVINGAEWLPDPAACEDQDDGYNGRNSLRYACEERPDCHAAADAGAADASLATDAGFEDAGLVRDGGALATDASVDSDAGVARDASGPYQNSLLYACEDAPVCDG